MLYTIKKEKKIYNFIKSKLFCSKRNNLVVDQYNFLDKIVEKDDL